MTSIREFLANDPLRSAEVELRRREALERFKEYFPADPEDIWLQALYKFIQFAPWRYWDPSVAERSLKIFECSPERTISAIQTWSRQIGIGFENLFRRAPTSEHEEYLSLHNAHDMLRLATEFHPEYLRCAQHIFANLITIYWAVLRKGSVRAKFDLRGAINLINSKKCNFLTAGYDDTIRNAIAHGEVVFRGESIHYGPLESKYELSGGDFFSRFDSLWRTSNALAITILLFLARNKQRFQNFSLPQSLIALLASASVERTGLSVIGVVESDLPLTGKQLHIAVKTLFGSREAVLLETARIAMHLIENGASGYSRFLFEINHGKAVSSLVIILPKKLEALLQQQSSFDRIAEIFSETQLLWYNEGKLRTKFRTWYIVLNTFLRLAIDNTQREWRKHGIWRGAGRYRIRKVENVSSGRISRVHIKTVLRYPSDANDKEMIKDIIHLIIRKYRRKWILTNSDIFKRKWWWPAHPKYIWVSLYKLDGTIRWLGACGWISGNLLAVAEKIYGLEEQPIFVPKPEEVWKGIRLRYSIDMEAAKEAVSKMASLMEEIKKVKQNTTH